MNKIVLVLALLAVVECSIYRRKCTIDEKSCKIVNDRLDEYERAFMSGNFDVIFKQFAENGHLKLMLHGEKGTAHETRSDYAGVYANIPLVYPHLSQLNFTIELVEKTDKILVAGDFELHDVAKTHSVKGFYEQEYNFAGQLLHHIIVASKYDGKKL